MASENIYTAAPTGHAMVITMDTRALIVDRIFALSELHGPVKGRDAMGAEADYVRVLVGDDVRALQGDRFVSGSSLCMRIGDRTVVCRYQRFTGRVIDASRGSYAARTGAYAGLAEVTTGAVIPEGQVIAQVPGPFTAQAPRENEDMYGALTWPPTVYREVHLARLWTLLPNGTVDPSRRFTFVPVF